MGQFPRGRQRANAALFFVALCASGALVAGCSGKPVASVNGQPLSETEFHRLCESATRVQPQGGTVGMQVLAGWIGHTLLSQEAKKLNIYPGEPELQQRVQNFRRQLDWAGTNFEDQLRRQGSSLEAFKRELLVAMVQESVMCNGVSVTEEEVKRTFDQQKKQFTQPAQVRISQITVDSEKARDQAKNELDAGAQFSLVAQTRSKDQFRDSGGQVPVPLPREVGRGGPVAQEAVNAAFKLKPGMTSEPIKVGATWILVRLEQKIEEKVPPIDIFGDIMRTQLRDQKARTNGKMGENQQRFMQSAQSAKIEIHRPEYAALRDNLRSQAAAGPPGAPGAGPPGASGPPPPPPGG